MHLVDVGPVGADHAVGRDQVSAGACDRVVLADGGEGAAGGEFRGGSADGIGLDGDRVEEDEGVVISDTVDVERGAIILILVVAVLF